MATRFVTEIVRIVGDRGALMEPGEHRYISIMNPPYMRLVIEAWDQADGLTNRGKRRISVGHYFQQDGDRMSDPEVVIDENGDPIEITMHPTGYYKRLAWRDNGVSHELRYAVLDIKRNLLPMWARNLNEQGFAKATDRVGTMVPGLQEEHANGN